MQAQFESIFKELGAAAAANVEPSGDATSPKIGPEPPFNAASAAAASAGAEATFQETIRKTMERMQTSGEQATAAATAEGSDDFLAELLKQMASGEGGGGEGNEEEFTKMLLGMMDQLTNKEILYEPMKELNEKFPEWLEKNKDKTPPEEYKNYKEQQVYVSEIVTKFEESTYADSNKADREYILERMQKVIHSHSFVPFYLDYQLTPPTRCKPSVNHLQTLLAICPPLKKHSVSPRMDALPSS